MASISLPSSAKSGVRGSQQPRIRHVPEYISSTGREAIELCALAGLQLDPWEELVLADALGERSDGKWAAFEVGVNVPRQNGKGTIIEGRELTGAFLLGEKLIVHSAHEQITSSEHFRRLLNLIEGVPEFEQRVMKITRGKGSEAIELRGRQRILFKTRTGGGGRGLTGDLVVLDEAMILPTATIAALVPTMAARSISGNPQLWYAATAVDQQEHEHGLVLALLRERALDGAPSMAYFEWSADVQAWLEAHGLRFDPDRSEIEQLTPALLADPEVWAQANPGLGIRISMEHIEREHGGALGLREFAVERLGVGDYPDTSAEADRVISQDAVRACRCTDQSKRIEGTKTFAVDVKPDRTWGSIAVAGQRGDGLLHTAVAKHERGTGWIISRDPETGEFQGKALDLHQEHPGSRFVLDSRGPAAGLIEPLKEAGLDVVEASTQDYANACAGFYDAVDQRRLKYPEPQPELEDALASARTAPMGEAWKWSRKHSTGADISPLVAATLAVWGAETLEETEREPLVAWR